MNEPPTPAERYQLHLFSLLPVFSTRLVREATIPYPERYRVKTPADAALLLQDYFAERDREEMLALLLDTGASVIGLVRLSVGGRKSTILDPAQVFKAALLANADSVILAHNHPSGNPEPSREDVLMTKPIVQVGKLLGISVHDHLIVTADGFTSLAERGLLD